jgi:iron-sulfur cluster repair protein YtfE (RIC family)
MIIGKGNIMGEEDAIKDPSPPHTSNLNSTLLYTTTVQCFT